MARTAYAHQCKDSSHSQMRFYLKTLEMSLKTLQKNILERDACKSTTDWKKCKGKTGDHYIGLRWTVKLRTLSRLVIFPKNTSQVKQKTLWSWPRKYYTLEESEHWLFTITGKDYDLSSRMLLSPSWYSSNRQYYSSSNVCACQIYIHLVDMVTL